MVDNTVSKPSVKLNAPLPKVVGDTCEENYHDDSMPSSSETRSFHKNFCKQLLLVLTGITISSTNGTEASQLSHRF